MPGLNGGTSNDGVAPLTVGGLGTEGGTFISGGGLGGMGGFSSFTAITMRLLLLMSRWLMRKRTGRSNLTESPFVP